MSAYSAYRRYRQDPFTRIAINLFWWTLAIGVIGASTWAIVWGSMGWQRGIYGGFHYNDARFHVEHQMIDQFGLAVFSPLTYQGENKFRIRSDRNFSRTYQVRKLNYLGPRGVPYCGLIWGGMDDRHTAVFKGKECAKIKQVS